MNLKPEIAVVVSETHWDREWYQPFQEFRYHLVQTFETLVDILRERSDYRCFVFDGQAVVLEDALEVAPELRGPLADLGRKGRIRFGPWYVLPDEFLVSGESLVRNLHFGCEVARAFGSPLWVGYVPDAFGHPAQLPQILARFGIRHAVMWRGMGEQADDLGSQFWWEGLDGSVVLTAWLPQGYGNFSKLGYPFVWGDTTGYPPSLEEADKRLRERLEVLRRYDRAGVHLLMNGVDHVPPQRELPDLLEGLRQRHPELKIVHGSFEDFFEILESRTDVLPLLKMYQGEFNSGKHSVILQGVYSSRVYLKQANFELETLLERYVEPLVALACATGGWRQWDRFVEYAWKELLKNHPHDDICGCSVDQVHRNNEHVYEQVREVAGQVLKDTLRHVGWHVDLRRQNATPFLIFNPAEFPRHEWSEVELWFDGQDERHREFRLITAEGQEVPFVRTGDRVVQGVDFQTAFRKHVVSGFVRLPEVPPVGWCTVYAESGVTEQDVGKVSVDAEARRVESRDLVMQFHADGTFDLTDKRSGETFRGLHVFEDTEDVGDSYDYSPAENSLTLTTEGESATLRFEDHTVCADVWVERKWALPESFDREDGRRSAETVEIPIRTRVRIWADSPRVDVRTEVNNRARDHRLRVHFPTDVDTVFADVDEHFCILRRPIALPNEKDPAQPPVRTRHFQRFVSLGRRGRGLAVATRGLHEVEVLERNVLALTLFRSFGWLSRPDLLTRPGHAGPMLPTPEGQCLRKLVFDYALLPHAGDVRRDDVRNQLLAFLLPPKVERANWIPSVGVDLPPEERPLQSEPRIERVALLPDRASLVTVQGEGVALSAVKRAWNSDDLVVRVYSVSPVAQEVTVRTLWPLSRVFEVNLDEVWLATLTHESRSFRFTIRPNEIRTFRLTFREGFPPPNRIWSQEEVETH